MYNLLPEEFDFVVQLWLQMIEVVLCSLIGPDLKLGYLAQLCKTHISVLRAVGEPVTYSTCAGTEQ